MDRLSRLRVEYSTASLLEEELSPHPLQLFQRWMGEAIEARILESNGMVLATLSEEGRPTTRTLLLKGVDRKGFLFFTHYTSRKGQHLALHPFASATFWWKEIYRQVCVEGRVEKISRAASHAYFKTRPRGAQLAAWTSLQSTPLATRMELDATFKQCRSRFAGKEIPCPPHWGGYRLVPYRMEFWQGRKSRLHDRFVYVQTNGEWIVSRLAP